MSITERNSVLILGAGVSEPFGLPLGSQLVDLIAQQIAKESDAATPKDDFGRKQLSSHRVAEWSGGVEWHKHPIFGTLARSKISKGQIAYSDVDTIYQELQTLRRLLEDQTAETIDAFIAENGRISELTKICMAAVLVSKIYAPMKNSPGTFLARPLSQRMLDCSHRTREPKSERNWVHLLINIIRHGIDEKTISPDNRIHIVTFNYDTVLEYVLEKQFRNRQSPLGDYKDYIDIHHVHGSFSGLEDQIYEPGTLALHWAKGISVVNEVDVPDSVIQARATARNLIQHAEKVYAVGFSFAGPNCRLIGLNEPMTRRTVTFCNYDGNRGIKESAERYCKKSTEEKAGDFARPLGVSDFIRAGYLGEPPG